MVIRWISSGVGNRPAWGAGGFGTIKVAVTRCAQRSRAGHGMDVFRVRDRLIDDYREFTGSFVEIHDPRISEHVAERMARGYQWPDPWLSLNPSFASGGNITDLVAAGLLHPE